jgi:hypothetical protein
MKSPYKGLSVNAWERRTRELIHEHPLEYERITGIKLGDTHGQDTPDGTEDGKEEKVPLEGL